MVPPRTLVERGFPRGLPEARRNSALALHRRSSPQRPSRGKPVYIFRTRLGIVDFMVEGKVSCDSFKMIRVSLLVLVAFFHLLLEICYSLFSAVLTPIITIIYVFRKVCCLIFGGNTVHTKEFLRLSFILSLFQGDSKFLFFITSYEGKLLNFLS